MVEMSFSYNATSKEPRSNFRYELIGTDGVIRYHREERSFEIRNSHGTQFLAWHPEKNFYGMHQEFAHAIESGQDRFMPTAYDGLAATKIARRATEQAIAGREPGSCQNHSTMSLADCMTPDLSVPCDSQEPFPSDQQQSQSQLISTTGEQANAL